MDKTQVLEKWLRELEKQGITPRDITQFLNKQKPKPNQIPTSIFTKQLGPLEAIVKFLRENQNLKLIQIAKKLDKNNISLAGSYRKAKQKHPEPFKKLDYKYSVPTFIFSNKRFSVLENLCLYLKDHYKLSYHELAVLLNRDERTIWTAYNRAKKKRRDT